MKESEEKYLGMVVASPTRLKDIPSKHRTDRVCFTAVCQQGILLKYVKKQTRAIQWAAIKAAPRAIVYVTKPSKAQIVYALIEYPYSALSIRAHLTPDIVTRVSKKEPYIILYVPDKYKTALACARAVALNYENLKWVPAALQTTKLCKMAIKEDRHALQYVKRQTPELCKLAVSRDPWAVKYARIPVNYSGVPAKVEKERFAKICGIIQEGGRHRLNMVVWHGPHWRPEIPTNCGTTHCLAGWAQALSTNPKIRSMCALEAGIKLIPRHAHLFLKSTDEVLSIIDHTLKDQGQK